MSINRELRKRDLSKHLEAVDLDDAKLSSVQKNKVV